jgi:hypothetical protein
VAYFDFGVSRFDVARFQTISAAAGGFDPILSLFTADGIFLADDDDDDFGLGGLPVGADSFDAYLEVELEPGLYRLAVSQSDNFFDPVAGVFSRAGQGDFTGGPFTGENGVTRTGAFAVAGAVPVPEPATALVALTGLLPLAGASLVKRRRS